VYPDGAFVVTATAFVLESAVVMTVVEAPVLTIALLDGTATRTLVSVIRTQTAKKLSTTHALRVAKP
jgi:hypothetical protein